MTRIVFPALMALVFSAAGCRDRQITTYRVPKEPEAKSSSAPGPAANSSMPAGDRAMASTPVATASGPGLAWTAPDDWQAKPAGGMRKGTYTILGEGGATAELAITAFPGDVGGEVANVNRWRGQIQLPPQSDAEVLASLTRFEANGLDVAVVDMANVTAVTPVRMLGAMVPHGGSTWFFKLTGPDALVAKAKPAFMEYLKTIRPSAE